MCCSPDSDWPEFTWGRTAAQDCAPSDTHCIFDGSQATCPADQLATNLGISTTPSDLIMCRNDSQNSRKHYTGDFSFIMKDTNQNLSKEKTQGDRFARVPNTNFSYLQDTSPPQHNDVWISIRQTQPSFSVKFSTGISLLRLTDSTNHWACDWTQSPASLSLSGHWKVGLVCGSKSHFRILKLVFPA